MLGAGYVGRGKLYLKQGRDGDARGEFEQAAKLDPQDPEALYGRGIARKHLGDARGGDGDIASAKRIDPMIANFFQAFGIKE